ncbi:MAG TPA: glutathionylspermidine synthase family protein, partial [Candidatus Obscuribacterales bacterium]
ETFDPRPYALEQAEDHGFTFHTIDGEPYWHEARAYCFDLGQIENDIEAPSNELGEMCYALAEEALQREDWLKLLQIPPAYWDWIRQSWERDDPTLYGRFDLVYDGHGPAKLLEFNADTPTSLYESAVFQWLWLEDLIEKGRLPAGADQFNSIEERLRAGIPELGIDGLMHLAAVTESDEDTGTVRYLEGLLRREGIPTQLLDISEIGVDAQGRFTDLQDQVITHLFKLYPWEMMVREAFGEYLPGCGVRFWEPPWKMVLSNKGILPLLWQMYPGHPNLLEAYFEGDPAASALGSRFVRKPIFSREGANVTIVDGEKILRIEGDYGAEGHVLQAYAPLPEFDGWSAVIGAWLIRGEAAGIGIREDKGPVTTNRSRFVPHYIEV